MQKKGPPGLPKEFERFNVKATDKEQITRPKTARNSEYLLFYVHLLLRVMKRMSAKGFTVVIPPTELSDRIKVAVLRDPSDMEVRLVELADAQFEEVASPPGPQPHQTPSTPSHSKKQWFCRLGYYTIPTARADETVKMYEKLFAQVAAIPGVPAGPGGPKKVDGPKPRVRMAFRKPANNPPQIAPVLTGFHQIDTEESVYGLSKTRCHWMGHESRNSGCTICFTELERADLKKILQVDRTSSRLIAVGFEVANLDAAAKRIDSDKAADLLLEPGGRVRVPGEGHFNRWKETINNICVELFVHKPPEQTAEGAKVTTEVVSLNERITGVAKDGEMAKLEIDYDHLYGLTRFLSAGAIRSVPTKPTATSARADRKTEQQKKPGQPSSQQKSSDARDIPAFRGESSGDREPKQTGDEVSGTKIKTIKVKMLRLKQGIELPPVGRTGHAENVRGPAAKVKNIPLGSQGKSSSMNW
ncbi:hypothetical protein DFJ73DRAFT_493361 [Zopfochytrium polystomum]|nr:hypothetical protein DFJ73DRAFT_493361 [Zopfochytrium polystomum]